jgi:low affinity Fe/Cu permease
MCESQSLISTSVVGANTNYAELTFANEAVGHPFHLVNKLIALLAWTAVGRFVHVMDPFNVFEVLLFI